MKQNSSNNTLTYHCCVICTQVVKFISTFISGSTLIIPMRRNQMALYTQEFLNPFDTQVRPRACLLAQLTEGEKAMREAI